MKPRLLILSCIIAVFACAAAACGDDDGGGGGGGRTTVDTGLPATDSLDSLDEEDATQACVETARALNSVLPESELETIACVVAALNEILMENEGSLSSSDEAMCKDITADCLKGEIDGQEIEIDTNLASEEDCENAGVSDTFEGCEATVADYERCVGKVASELRTRLRAVKCEGLRDPEALEKTLTADIDVADSPECKSLRDKCPEIELGDE